MYVGFNNGKSVILLLLLLDGVFDQTTKQVYKYVRQCLHRISECFKLTSMYSLK